MIKLEQPQAIKIAKIIEETKDSRTFGFYHSTKAKPGQFILLWLPRVDMKPFGISRQEKNYFEITVCKVGPFTKALFHKKVGDWVGIQGPYGTSFDTSYKSVAIVAGGYGVAPLAFLADVLLEKGADVTFIYGAKTADRLIYQKRFKNNPNFKIIWVTDDGSFGERGFATDALERVLVKNNKICP